MIRIIDEPVFEMTMEEYSRLTREYWEDTGPASCVQFQEWLEHVKGWPHTRVGRLKP